MKNNIVRIIFLVLSLAVFVSMIVFTNDNIKEKIETSKILPLIAVVSIMIVLIVLLWQRKIKS